MIDKNSEDPVSPDKASKFKNWAKKGGWGFIIFMSVKGTISLSIILGGIWGSVEIFSGDDNKPETQIDSLASHEKLLELDDESGPIELDTMIYEFDADSLKPLDARYLLRENKKDALRDTKMVQVRDGTLIKRPQGLGL